MNDTKTFTPIYQVYYDGGWHDKETNEMWAYPADGGWEVRVLYEAPISKVEPCAVCGEGTARLVVLRSCDTCESEYAGQAEMKLTAGLVQRVQEPVMWVTVEDGVWVSTRSADFRHIANGQYQLYVGPLQNDVVAAISTLKALGYVYNSDKFCKEGEQWIAPPKHSDDSAVDRFAVAMKAKLADARTKGRSGWELCQPQDLSQMLREHVEKGDPRDVANFCMMLWNIGVGITAQPVNHKAAPELLSWHEIFELAQLHSVTPNENLVSFTRSVEAIIGTKT